MHPEPCSHAMTDRGEFRQSLPSGHVIATMMDEHQHILEQLDRLEEILHAVGDGEPTREQLVQMQGIGDFLVSSALAILLLSLVAFGYLRSDQASRRVSLGIVIFIAALGFVGVGVDAIHQFTNGTVRGMFA